MRETDKKASDSDGKGLLRLQRLSGMQVHELGLSYGSEMSRLWQCDRENAKRKGEMFEKRLLLSF